MKQIFLTATMALGSFFLFTNAFSQKKDSQVIKKEEIIIQTDGDKTTKTIIEINGDDVKVNGQPLKEYKGADVKVMRRKAMVANSNNFLKRPDFNFNLNKNENRTFLGVMTQKNDKGSVIKSVTKGSSAEKAGLKENDVITKFGDKPINDPDDLAEVVKTYKPGDEVTVSYLRDNKKKSAKVILGKSDNFASAYSFKLDSLNSLFFKMPEIKNLGGLDRRYFKMFNEDKPQMGIEIQDTENSSGVKILNVAAGSIAEKSGLKQEDIITEVNGNKITNVQGIRSEMANSNNGDTYHLKLKRENKEISVDVVFPKKLNKMKL